MGAEGRAGRVADLLHARPDSIESPTRGVARPVQGQAFFYFGDYGDRFVREFADVGVIYPRAQALA